MNRLNLIDQKFGRLTVTEELPPESGNTMWLCICECGNTTTTKGTYLNQGHTKSCGCLRKDITTNRNTKHGLRHHPLYSIWKSMVQRCTNAKSNYWYRYGGRGITVCEEWLDVSKFIEDMENGYKVGLTLDRIDNNKGYFKDNCRWVSWSTQNKNKSDASSRQSKLDNIYYHKRDEKWMINLRFKTKKEAEGFYTQFIESNL